MEYLGRGFSCISFVLKSTFIAALLILVTPTGGHTAESGDATRGKYLFDAAGCGGCHTDTKHKGAFLAGGLRLQTPFGSFYSPNITPHKEYGIGNWSDDDFVRAATYGIGPDGRHYFPVFPFPSFTGISRQDLIDIKSYIFTTPAVGKPNRNHDVSAPFGWRFLNVFWKWLFFHPGPFVADPARTPEWNRGAYLVEALSHCGECHTPRNLLGAINRNMALAGTADAPDGGIVPNITPDKETGIGNWSPDELRDLLKDGMLPDGDFVGDSMAEVVENTTSRLTDGDINAMISYLLSQKAIFNPLEMTKTEE